MDRDLFCFAHLAWEFVYQRPNHLMSRAARDRRVFFFEEPVAGPSAALDVAVRDGVTVVRPRVPAELSEGERNAVLAELLTSFAAGRGSVAPVAWYYTPMALPWSSRLAPAAVVYDVMDELSQFRFAPPQIRLLEDQLLARADVVFTGGRQLFEARRDRHPNVHLSPSSVDVSHFRQARDVQPDPADQASIGRPRLGYFGVIDERVDLQLLGGLAARRPDWHFVLVGPTAKIDPADVPAAPTIHMLGLKPYAALPRYLAGWGW